MNVTQSLKHIDRAVSDADANPEEYDATTRGQSPRQAYQQTIEAVRDVAGEPEAKQLARWIEDEIRTDAKLPSSERVREAGADVCREAGQPVPADDRLGR